MATNITPEMLAALEKYYADPRNAMSPFQQDGTVYQLQGGGEYAATDPKNYLVYDASKTNPGQTYGMYGDDGAYQRDGTFKKDDGLQRAMKTLAIAAAAYGGLNMLGNSLGGAGTAGSIAGDAYLPGALSGDAYMPAFEAAGGGAVDTAAMGAGAGDLGYASGLDHINSLDAMSDAFTANGGYGAGGFGGTSGSYLDNLVNGSGPLTSRVLGGTGAGSTAASAPAGTVKGIVESLGGSKVIGGILGGLLGSKTGDSSVTRENVPEWLKPYVLNLLQGAQNHYAGQVASMPGQTALMQGVGNNMLSGVKKFGRG